jgi:predicted transcriptional regulator
MATQIENERREVFEYVNNPSELAKAMLLWEEMSRELDLLEEIIERAVVLIGETQVVGNVRVTYSKGRSKYDYESVAVREFTPEQLADYTTHVEEQVIEAHDVIDYMKACKDNKVEPDLVSAGTPSAEIKVNG